MWIVIVSTALINLYSYLYSQILYFAPQCHYSTNQIVYNWNSNLYRFITDILWLWPLTYIFWPVTRTFYFTRLTKQQQKEERMSIRTSSIRSQRFSPRAGEVTFSQALLED